MSFPSLDAGVLRRQDNYLPLRHLAALMVIYGHSYALTRQVPGQSDIIAKLMPGFYAGNLAVYLFFAISGYLVTLSMLRKPGLWRYIKHRFRRVYPAYVVCLLVCVFVIGALFSTMPLSDYLQASGTWQYLGKNLQPVSMAWELPGVFENSPYPRVVNGTLWSLSLEVRWYFYLGLMATLTIVRRRWAFTAVALGLAGFGAWEWWSGKPDVNDYRALSQTFLIAALCAHWRDRIPVSHALMAAFVVVAAVTHGTRWFAPAATLAAIYFTFWMAYGLPALRWPGDRDYSYGLFLYGFPVQQSLLAVFPQSSPGVLFFAATAVALACAALSWHLIEQPFMRGKPVEAPPHSVGAPAAMPVPSPSQ